jgi:hypothetical protein
MIGPWLADRDDRISQTMTRDVTLEFFKQIVECTAGIGRPDWGDSSVSAAAAGITRFSFDRCTCHKEATSVAQIFLCYSFRNRLCALEPSRSIKMPAVFAAMKIGFAFLTLAFVLDVNRRRDDRSTQRATQYFLKPRHFHGSRCFSGFRTAWSTFWLFTGFFVFPFDRTAVAILVAALAVFSFHRKGCGESIPVCSSECTVVLSTRLHQFQTGVLSSESAFTSLRSASVMTVYGSGTLLNAFG